MAGAHARVISGVCSRVSRQRGGRMSHWCKRKLHSYCLKPDSPLYPNPRLSTPTLVSPRLSTPISPNPCLSIVSLPQPLSLYRLSTPTLASPCLSTPTLVSLPPPPPPPPPKGQKASFSLTFSCCNPYTERGTKDLESHGVHAGKEVSLLIQRWEEYTIHEFVWHKYA